MKIGKKKIILLGVLAAASLVFILMVLSSSSPRNDSSLAVLPLSSGQLSNQDILLSGEHADIAKMLNVLKNVSFENVSLFDDDVFNGLIDFSVKLPSSDIGKSNPFSSSR